MGIIYKATSKESGKAYIGQTRETLARRVKKHKYTAKCRPSQTAFTKAITKYGIENLVFEIVEECPDETLNERECFWIQCFNTLVPNGYNLTTGGNSYVMSEATRQKLSESCKGRKISKEQREAQSRALSGRKLSPEHIEKRTLSQQGVQWSEETNKKRSESLKERYRLQGSKVAGVPRPDVEKSLGKSYIVTSPTGEETCIFCISRFCRENGLCLSAMCGLATGSSGAKSHKGWLCRRDA